MSLATPLGNEVDVFARNMFAGESGILDIRGINVDASYPVPYAGLIDSSLGWPPIDEENFALETEILVQHLLEKMFASQPQLPKVDAVLFSSYDGLPDWGSIIQTIKDPVHGMNRWAEKMPDIFYIAEFFKRHGCSLPPRKLISGYSTCTTGNMLIGQAFHRIRSGSWERALVGCAEQRMRNWVLMPYQLMRVLSAEAADPRSASCPFDARRSGFVKAEGAGLILLESERAAEARHARPLAYVRGYGQTSDAMHLSEGREDTLAAVEALTAATRDGAIALHEVDYINAHGTGTVLNDRLETQVIKNTFGRAAHAIPISSLKSQTGHTNLACGIIEAIACVAMLRAQVIAPTINYLERDPGCDLDYVPNSSRPARLKYVLSNSFGFGGCNSSLLLERAN